MKQKKKITRVIGLSLAVALIVFAGGLGFIAFSAHEGHKSGITWTAADAYDGSSVQTVAKKDGEDFVILQISDIQSSGLRSKEKRAFGIIDAAVEKYKPDLLYLAGDTVAGIFNGSVARRIVDKLDTYKIPYMMVFGNHDNEGFSNADTIGDIYQRGEYSLFQKGPENIRGTGNYIVNVVNPDGGVFYSLIAMDSNRYTVHPFRGSFGGKYDKIYPDQIAWYEWAVKSVSAAQYGAYDPESGKVVSSLLMFHIPLPEFTQAVPDNGKVADGIGERNEKSASPKENTGLFDKILELKSTTGIYAGHDHTNNFSVDYKGIKLTYGVKTGTGSYHNKKIQGCSVIRIKDDKTVSVELYMV